MTSLISPDIKTLESTEYQVYLVGPRATNRKYFSSKLEAVGFFCQYLSQHAVSIENLGPWRMSPGSPSFNRNIFSFLNRLDQSKIFDKL